MHRDANGDGMADESKAWFTGGPRGGNMEHQPSGLVWGMDNWIYTTYNAYRLRWNGEGGAPLKEPTAANGGQWGLAQDDYGKMWWSNAGGEKGLWNFQVADRLRRDQRAVAEGAGLRCGLAAGRRLEICRAVTGKSREDGTLNHFTGVRRARHFPRRPAARGTASAMSFCPSRSAG